MICPTEYTRIIKLPDGTVVRLRLIRADDEGRWLELLGNCSNETIYLRFRKLFEWNSPQVARSYCTIDLDREIALVAEVTIGNVRRIIGVGRLVLNQARDRIEYAVLISDDWQNKGIGGILTKYCLQIAREWKEKRVVANTTCDNRRVISVLRKNGFEVLRERGYEVILEAPEVSIDKVPDNCGRTKILDVDYVHLSLETEGDLYLTKYGMACLDQLRPRNFLTDEYWFDTHSLKLLGTSHVYKVRTKEVDGMSKDVVIKWNRMGQDVPGAEVFEELLEFNSPFEEFSLVMELRTTKYESRGEVNTQKPLAIYVPSKRMELWESGRHEYLFRSKARVHGEIELDILRQYAVIYEWLEGIDASFACERGLLNADEVERLTLRVDDELRNKGFFVKDRKPHHIIVTPLKNGDFERDGEGSISYGIVDFELLERTPQRDEIIQKAKRMNYLKRQRDRFIVSSPVEFPSTLSPVNIFGVDYVYGKAETTGGALWVVGNDPDLFDYFLPERWERTAKTRINSIIGEIYHTSTRDNVDFICVISKAGTVPDVDPIRKRDKRILEHGYNSPFEEMGIAMELNRQGIPIIYPRAIYMSGNKTEIEPRLVDVRRYESHRAITDGDGMPVFRKDRDYVSIWGFWEGPDEKLAAEGTGCCEGISALHAYSAGIIDKKTYLVLQRKNRDKLWQAGFEDLAPTGSHLLLSLDRNGSIILNDQGSPEVRICHFELIRKRHF